MAADYFLLISGIEGESTDAKFKGALSVLAFSWGETQTGTASVGGAAGAGRVQMQDFQFTAQVSKASPKLLLTCATGQILKEVKLVGRRAGGQQLEFMSYTFNDVLISSYQVSGSGGDDGPMDQVSISFGRLKAEYRAQKPDGSLDVPVTAGWDLKSGKQA